MDLLATQPYHDNDNAATQKIDMVPDKIQNEQVGVLIVNSKSYPIYEGVCNIGRNSHCNIHLEDQSISKYHAEIEAYTYPTPSWISDLNSCNKTLLNNVVLRPARYYELKDNSIIQFGRIRAIYKSCHSRKALTIPETPERVDQSSVTVSHLKTPDSLLITHSTSNKSNCKIMTIQEYSKKSISCTFTNQSAQEILQNMSKQNISTEINVSACEQNSRNSSYESDDIFDAATQHVNIDSYLKHMQKSSLQEETEKCEENVSNIDNTITMEQKCKAIGSTSTPIKKTNVNDQVEKLNSIKGDIASAATKHLRSKNDSSHSIKENNKEEKDNVDLNSVETQLISFPDCISNPKEGQTNRETSDNDNMETLNTQIIEFSELPCRVNGSSEKYKKKNDTDIYSIDTQIINIESNNGSDSAKKLQANRIDITKCNSSVEDIDYETASTQVIGEMNITNSKTFKLAKSNFQSDLQDNDDDILSRLPEVTISGTLSNSSNPVALVKRTNKTRKFHRNTKTADKFDASSKMNKTKSIDKNATDTTLNESDKDSNKMTKSLISQKNKRSSHSMDKRSSTKENIISVKSSNDESKMNTRNKTIKKNTRKRKNEIPKRNSRSMTKKERGEKNDTSEEEMGEESQEVAMIMENSLINDSKTKNIGQKRKRSNVNSDDNSLNNSYNVSRKGETSNEKYKTRVLRAKQKNLNKNNTSQSSLDSSMTDDSLIRKDRNKRSLPSTRNSSLTRSTNMEKEIDQNSSIALRKRKKKESELLMDVIINIRTPDTRKSISNVNSNSSFSTPKEKVLFTGLTDDDYVKVLKVLGAVKVDDPSECTVLVTDKIRRTTKFLCTLAKAIPIVSVNWLLESKRAGHFLDWNNYFLKDPAMEAKYGFRLRKSLEKAKERQLLDGYIILLTPNIVSPPIPELKAMIASCGGKAVLRAPIELTIKTVIISNENDLNKVNKWLVRAPKGVTVQSTEFLLTGILKQELDFDKYKLM
ncbi:hypothetical protein M0804_012789 [Polistes exclamans]|nr:hypothetical protein M0804_012789 [Polistes exclamans]